MPSPVGHSIIAFTFYRLSARPHEPLGWRKLALYLFAANAPDLDFIPGLLIGQPDRFHHGAGHSVGNAQQQFLSHAIEWVWKGYAPKEEK